MISGFLCACGCGEIIEPFDKRGRPKIFIRGHHLRERYVKMISEYVAPEDKKCTICGNVKLIADFSKVSYTAKSTGETYFRYKSECKLCHKQYIIDNKEKIKEQRKQYNLDHQKEITEYKASYQLNNKEEISKQRKQYYQENKEELIGLTKIYYFENKNNRRKYNTEYFRNRRKNDPVFRLRSYISNQIRFMLKHNGSIKNKKSVWNYISFENLKIHIEQQFESWMTWDNQGTYNSKIWDDNNKSTWTW